MRDLVDEAWFLDCDLQEALRRVVARQVCSSHLDHSRLYAPLHTGEPCTAPCCSQPLPCNYLDAQPVEWSLA